MQRAKEKAWNYISPHLTDIEKAEYDKWLHELESGDLIAQKLLCCLAIDLDEKLISHETYVEIIRCVWKMDSKLTPSEKFEEAIRVSGHAKTFVSEYGDDVSTRYVTVVSDRNFVKYQYNFSQKAKREGKPNTQKDLVDNLLEEGELEEIALPNGGKEPREIAWVTPFDDFERVINQSKENIRCCEVLNALGLPQKEDQQLFVYLEYPEEFGETFHQPCALNSPWNKELNLYLSYSRKDGFGRTRPCDGDYDPDTHSNDMRMREKIHVKTRSDHQYKVRRLGRYWGKYGRLNTDFINKEALRRLAI